MFELLQNTRSIVPDGLNLVRWPRKFVHNWKSAKTKRTHPLFVLVCEVGLFVAVTTISNVIGLDRGFNRWFNTANPEIVAPPEGFPSLLTIGKLSLVGVHWPLGFGVGIQLTHKDENKDTYPLASFQVGAFEATFANLPAKLFSLKGGLILLILLYAFAISIVAHPACLLFKGHASYKECISFLVLVMSFYMLIVSILILILHAIMLRLEYNEKKHDYTGSHLVITNCNTFFRSCC
jgi:hypothetical protein